MNKLTFSVFLFVGIIQLGFSQKNAIEGFIISKSNDTIPGTFKKQGGLKKYLRINFKERDDSEFKKISPAEINGYFLEEDNFVSRLVKLPQGETNVFLYEAVRGKVSLYYAQVTHDYSKLTDQNKSLEKNALTFQSNDVFLIKDGNGEFFQLKEKFVRGLLKSLLTDCPKIHKKFIHKNNFEVYDFNFLYKLIVEYNKECLNEEIIVNEKLAENRRMKFDIGGKLLMNKGVIVELTDGNNRKGMDSSSKIQIGGGLYGYLWISKLFSLGAEVLYIRRNSTLSGTPKYATLPNVYLYKFDNISIPVILRVSLPTEKKIKPNFNIGVVPLNFVFNDNYTIPNTFMIPVHQGVGLICGIGAQIPLEKLKRSLKVEFRYERNGLHALGQSETILNSFQFHVGIDINKNY